MVRVACAPSCHSLLDSVPACVFSHLPGHFGIRLRNGGSVGDLQVSLFVSSAQSRFWVARPRDLVLAPSQERYVDIRAPLYLVEAESNLHDKNVTCSIQSNAGTAHFPLDVDRFPVPGPNVHVFQTTNGAHAWHVDPVGAHAQRMHAGYIASLAFLSVLMCGARAVRIHLHGPYVRRPRRRGHPHGDTADGDCVWDDEEALHAVRELEAREGALQQGAAADDMPPEAAAARARAKALALDAWHAQTHLPSSAEGPAAGEPDDCDAASATPGSPSCCSVCLVRPRDAALLPCRHVALCGPCAERLCSDGAASVCPICRRPIDTWLQLYMA